MADEKNLPTAGEEKEQREYEMEQEFIKEEKKPKIVTFAIIALSVLLAFAIYVFFSKGDLFGKTAFRTEDASTVIQEHENPPLKAESLDPTKVYSLSNASDTLNNGTIDIKKAQFRKDQTRLWVHFKNTGSNKINMMPGATAILVDNNGHSYKADPFASQQMTGIAPGADEDVMLVFEPLRADAKQVMFHMDMVFDMKRPAWQVAIPVNLP